MRKSLSVKIMEAIRPGEVVRAREVAERLLASGTSATDCWQVGGEMARLVQRGLLVRTSVGRYTLPEDK